MKRVWRRIILFLKTILSGYSSIPAPPPQYSCAHCGYEYSEQNLTSYVHCGHCKRKYRASDFASEKHPYDATKSYFLLCVICEKKDPKFNKIRFYFGRRGGLIGYRYLWEKEDGEVYEVYHLSDTNGDETHSH